MHSAVAPILVVFYFLLLSQSAVSQTTTVPSSPPPSGTTGYEAVRARAAFVSWASSSLRDFAVKVDERRRIAELGPVIDRAMPKQGGVLLRAVIATEKTGSGQPRSQELRSLWFAGAGLSKGEAKRRYLSTPGIRPTASKENDDLYDFHVRDIWIPAQSLEAAKSRVKSNVELERALRDYEQTSRLAEAEWKWIVAEHTYLEGERATKSDGVGVPGEEEIVRLERQLAREEQQLASWLEAQRKIRARLRELQATQTRAIGEERLRLENMEGQTAALRREIESSVYRLCPNQCSFEQCDHEDRKKMYRDAQDTKKADYENRMRTLGQWRAEIGARESKLAATNKELTERDHQFERQESRMRNRIEDLKANVRQAKENADLDARRMQTSISKFTDHVRSYQQARQRLREIETTIHDQAANSPLEQIGVP